MTLVELSSDLMKAIREEQVKRKSCIAIREAIAEGRAPGFADDSLGLLRFQGRVVVPEVPYLREMIMFEAHCTPYSVHPRSSKMYKDLRKTFWWQPMKTDVVEFVARCLVCQ